MDRALIDLLSEALCHHRGHTDDFENCASYRVDIADIHMGTMFGQAYLASRIIDLREFLDELEVVNNMYFFTSTRCSISVHFIKEEDAILFKLAYA